MCKWGTHETVYCIRRNNDLYPDGWHPIAVDSCLAPTIREMNERGIITTGCCCGHGNGNGFIGVATESAKLLSEWCFETGHSYHFWGGYLGKYDNELDSDGNPIGSNFQLIIFLPKLELTS